MFGVLWSVWCSLVAFWLVLVVAVSQMLALVVFGVLWVFGALWSLSGRVLVVAVSQMLALGCWCSGRSLVGSGDNS